MMMGQVDHINVELGLGIEGWVGPVAIWRVHVTSRIHSNPIWDKQNICDRTWGGKRWKVWVSDLCTTLSTSLYQLSYWLREALLTDSHNEWGEKETNLFLVKISLTFSSLCFIKVPQYGRTSLLCLFGRTSYHAYTVYPVAAFHGWVPAQLWLIFSQAMLRPAARSERWHSH